MAFRGGGLSVHPVRHYSRLIIPQIVVHIFLVIVLSAHEIRMKSGQIDPAVFVPATKPVTGGSGHPSAVIRGEGEREVFLVQWNSPMASSYIDQLIDHDCIPLLPIPDQTWLILGPPAWSHGSFSRMIKKAAGEWPDWVIPMEKKWKIHPRVLGQIGQMRKNIPSGSRSRHREQEEMYHVQLAESGGEGRALQFIRENCVFYEHYASFDYFQTWTIRASPQVVSKLLLHNCVFWIEPRVIPTMHGERGALNIAGKLSSLSNCVEEAGGGFQEWLEGHALSGDGITVHVMDDGLSRGDDTNKPGTSHPDIIGRIAGIDNATGELLGNSIGGHGHINASSIAGSPLAGAGRTDNDGYFLGQGVAPAARIFATKIFNNSGQFEMVDRGFRELVLVASRGGAMISCNSWGSSVNGEYTSESQLFDSMTRDADRGTTGFQEMLFIFSAGNDGPVRRSISAPGSAKNVITVGASENCDSGEIDGCGYGPGSADNIREVASFSARGPMSDGRLAPLLLAAGTHVSGAASDDISYDGSSVCGRMNVHDGEQLTDSRYYPAFQSDYTWSSGTSHSAPLVAGAAALLYERYNDLNDQWPSPALVKSTLVASAVNTHGEQGGGDIADQGNVPNFDAGWGRVNLRNVLGHDIPFFIHDQQTVLTRAGETWKVELQVLDSGTPLKIVLSWTDAIAAPAASVSLVNDLDLVVTKEHRQWKGNVFSNGESTEGGDPDSLNNVESVFLLDPEPGIYSVTVRANSILGDALPGQGGSLQQDFAIFALNGDDQSQIGIVSINPDSLACNDIASFSVSDLDLIGSGTTTICVETKGSGDRENMVLHEVAPPSGVFEGKLPLTGHESPFPDDQVLSVSHGEVITASYTDETLDEYDSPLLAMDRVVIDCLPPVLVRNKLEDLTESSVSLIVETDEPSQVFVEFGMTCDQLDLRMASLDFRRSHDIVLENLPDCTPLFFTIELVDAAGNSHDPYQEGQCFSFQTRESSSIFEDFIEPVAKPGWTTEVTMGSTDWITSDSEYARSPSHAWYVMNPDETSDIRLISPPIFVEAGGTLVFWHTHEFESSGNVGLDGGVIEISNDNGMNWTDLGPAILEGGYNNEIEDVFSNPLGGRKVWSGGVLGEMDRVVVNLQEYEGQMIHVRFRLGSDEVFGRKGWLIDDIVLTAARDCIGELAQIEFIASKFNCSGQLRFILRDAGLARLGAGPNGGFSIATSGQMESTFPIQPGNMNMIDPAGIWEGFLAVDDNMHVSDVIIHQLLPMDEDETLRLFYEDPDVIGVAQSVYQDITLDCTPPVIQDLSVAALTHEGFTLNIRADEPIWATLYLGTTAGNLNRIFAMEPIVMVSDLYIGARGLDPCTGYYYQVDIGDEAGNMISLNNHNMPYMLTTGFRIVFEDDLEAFPADGWTSLSARGQAFWDHVKFEQAITPDHAWFIPNASTVEDASLILPPLTVSGRTILSFYHTYELEPSFDGGLLEISVDGGNKWTDLLGDILKGSYNGELSPNFNNPLGGRKAWTGGKLGIMSKVVVNLGPYMGRSRLVRFRMGTDSSVGDEGWYLDNITLEIQNDCDDISLVLPPLLLMPRHSALDVSLEQPFMLEWAGLEGGDGYEVFLGVMDEPVRSLGRVQGMSMILDGSILKAGTRYHWRVDSLDGIYRSESSQSTFRTRVIPAARLANEILGVSPGLDPSEQQMSDYDNNGAVEINDLVINVNRQE